MTKVAVLASHNGSGLDALYKAGLDKTLEIEISLVISNNSDANVLHNASLYGIDNFIINNKIASNPHAEIERLLKEYDCEIVFLSGYMKKLASNITQNFQVINSHPSLLPKYGGVGMYGRYVHEAVIKNREATSGVTIHKVNENYDEGKIILQKSLTLAEDESIESLQAKIKSLEAEAIVEGFQLCLK